MASKESEPGFEDSAEDALSAENSELLDVISSEELELSSEDEPSAGCSRGQGELPSEELDFVSSEDEASPGDVEELRECEELLSEDSAPEPEGLPAGQCEGPE